MPKNNSKAKTKKKLKEKTLPRKIVIDKSIAKQTTTPKKEKVGILYFITPPGDSIYEDHVSLVRNAISGAKAEKLYLVINSNGGVPYSAVRTMRIIRKNFKEIFGVVPHSAMSSATLMLLGTNAIYMSEESQLGPLDLPMEHPSDGSRISALDVVQSLTQIESTANEFATQLFDELRNGFGKSEEMISKEKALEMSLSHASRIVKPLVEKIDPYHRQRAMRKLRIGRWFAIDLLTEAMMIGNYKKAGKAADRLVSMFPDHSYSIFREDASMMCFLEIRNSENLTMWDDILMEADRLIAAKKTKIVYTEKEITS